MIYEKLYKALDRLVPGGLALFLYGEGEGHVRLKSEGWMPLVIEKIGPDRISLAHYFEQNGDLMADPEMEVRIDVAHGVAEALTYRLDSLGVRTVAYPEEGKVNVRVKASQNSFLALWLRNLSAQGFMKRAS